MERTYHLIFIIFLAVPVIMAVVQGIRLLKEPVVGLRQGTSWMLVVSISLIYVLAFNFVFFVQELFLAAGKYWLGLTAHLYHNNHDWEGSHPMTHLLQGSGALSIFILGVVMAMLHYYLKNKTANLLVKVLVWFLALEGLLQALSQVQTAFVAPQTDAGQAMGYLGIDGAWGMAITLASSTIIVLTVWVAMKEFYVIGLFSSKTRRSSWKNVMTYLILPVMIGSVLIIPYRVLPWDRGFMQFGHLMVWIPWVLAFSFRKTDLEAGPFSLQTMSRILAISAIAMLIFFQAVLATGLRFVP